VDDWFAEPPYAGCQQRYRVLQRLHAQTTAWQTLEVLDLEGPGRALILAGTLQTSLNEEFTYHEPLVHIPMFAHPNPHRVLIIGGGDGGALRHVLMHPSVDRALEVEIDQAVVEACLRFLPELSDGAYADPRSELKVQDGARFVADLAAARMARHRACVQEGVSHREAVPRLRADLPGHAVELGGRFRRGGPDQLRRDQPAVAAGRAGHRAARLQPGHASGGVRAAHLLPVAAGTHGP
jgi:hypothetical protein